MVTGGLTGAFAPSHLSALLWSGSEGTGGGGRAPGKMCRATSVRREGRISAQGVHTKMQRCLFVPRRLPRNLSNRDANLLGTVGQGGAICELATLPVTLPGKGRDPVEEPSLSPVSAPPRRPGVPQADGGRAKREELGQIVSRVLGAGRCFSAVSAPPLTTDHLGPPLTDIGSGLGLG